MWSFIVIILLSIHGIQAKSDAQLAKQAYQSAQLHNVDEAIQLYQEIEKKDAAVWYNLGMLSFEQGLYPEALLYWLRAQRQADAKHLPSVWHNLSLLKQKMTGQEEGIADWFSYWSLWVSKAYGIRLLQLSVLLLWLAFWFRHKMPKPVRTAVPFGLIVALLLCVPIISAYRLHKERGVIIKQEVQLYNGPNTSFHTVETLQSGALVRVEQHKEGWCQIAYNGLRGWLIADDLALV